MQPVIRYFDAPHLVPEQTTPAQIKTHKIAYTQWGDAENPRVLMCLHGLTRNGRDFDYLARALCVEYRVICPDLPGRGKSEWFEDKSLYAVPLYVADMLALLSHLNIAKLDWVGTSLGGIIGMVVASMQPGLIGRLVLNDVGPFLPKEGIERIGTYVGQAPRQVSRDKLEKYIKDIMKPFNIIDEEHWQHIFTHSIVIHPDQTGSLHYDPGIRHAFVKKDAPIEDIDMWELWESITCPVLVVRGAESDVLTAETLERMQQTGPKAEGVTLPYIGHAPTLMEDGQIAIVKNWLLK